MRALVAPPVPAQPVLYLPVDKNSLYVGRRYYLKLESHKRYHVQTVRDRILVNHAQGLHVGETLEEYDLYRKELDLWCDKGRIFEKHVIPQDIPAATGAAHRIPAIPTPYAGAGFFEACTQALSFEL